MKPQSSVAVVDDLARLAGSAEPPALDDASARRMVDVALRTPSAAAVTRPRWGLAIPFAATALCAVALLVWWSRPRSGPTAEPLRLTLPTGDRLAGTAGAHFEIEELVPTSRRVHLDAGAMVFDVAHVAAGQRFEVATDRAVAIATGTVFSVAVGQGETRVHVFEGGVVVLHDGQREAIAAGASWSSGGRVDEPSAITAAGESFARERSALVQTGRVPHVDVAPLPAPTTPSATAPVAAAPAHVPPAVTARAAEVVAPERPAVPSVTPPTTSEPAPGAASIELARADIAAGRYADALAKSTATSRTGTSGEWDLVRGDALRALGRTADAAVAFEAAAKNLPSPTSLEAAYSAAYLRHHELHASKAALDDLTGVDDPGSPLEERALVLRVEALVSLSRPHEAEVFAARYIDRFPKGESAQRMRTLLRNAAPKQ